MYKYGDRVITNIGYENGRHYLSSINGDPKWYYHHRDHHRLATRLNLLIHMHYTFSR